MESWETPAGIVKEWHKRLQERQEDNDYHLVSKATSERLSQKQIQQPKAQKRMKIAIDYDNTFSADPRLFAIFAQAATVLGHEVAIVTSRHPSVPIPMANFGLPVIYCAFKAKRGCYQADIWIDDDPKHIDQDHDARLLGPEWWPECLCPGGLPPGVQHSESCGRYMP